MNKYRGLSEACFQMIETIPGLQALMDHICHSDPERSVEIRRIWDSKRRLGLVQGPVPDIGAFGETELMFAVTGWERGTAEQIRAATVSEYTGKKCLYKPEKSDECGAVYFEMREGEVGHLSGYDGFYALDQPARAIFYQLEETQ